MKLRDLFPHLEGCNIVVWGTGAFYRQFRSIVHFDPVCFVDNNQARQGQYLDGKEIVHPGKLLELRLDQLVIMIMSSFESEIKSQINELGIEYQQILVWSDIERAIASRSESLDDEAQSSIPGHDEFSQSKCDLCGNSKFSLLYSRGRPDRKQLHYICEHCGFVFALPRLSPLRSREQPHENHFSLTERQALVRLRLLESVCPDLFGRSGPERMMIEIGSGTGSFVHLMNLYGWNATGIETDTNFANAARERYNVDVQVVALENMDLPIKSADLVCSFHVIEHVSSPSAFLKQASLLLNDNGCLYIECPGIDRMHKPIDDFFGDIHLNTFSEKVLRSFMAKAGFEWIQSGYNDLGFLWVIGRKTLPQKTQITYEKPQSVKNIVLKSYSPFNINASQIAVNPEYGAAKYRIAHVGIHKNTNAGDTLLFPTVRQVFQQELGNVEFDLIDIHQPVTSSTLDRINQSDALVIGGGGLFLSDTNENSISGWQWPISVTQLDQINVPIIVFAVGYNRFRGQPEFAPIFKENVRKLVEKSAFFGLRNNGSLNALRQYLPENLQDKPVYQPCPTTVLNKLQFGKLDRKKRNEKTVVVNVAMDRAGLRFGAYQKEIAGRMAAALRKLQNDGWEIRLYHHHIMDEIGSVWFRGQGLELTEVDLNGAPPYDVLRYYADADLCMGMRGHAQMVSFGLGVPVLSLISHDKLGFFLEDIQRTEWGVEVLDTELTDKMIRYADLSNLNRIRDDIRSIQEKLWDTTRQNLRLIRAAIDARAAH